MACNVIVRVILIVSVCVLAANNLQYSELEELKVEKCPSRNSCTRTNSDFDKRVCECDSKCAFYNDCCIDANRGRPKKVTTQICMQYGNFSYNGVYTISYCPPQFEGPSEVRSQCRDGDTRDPILNAPVTDTSMNRTYKNSYCALCNEASPTDLTIWQISSCKANTKPSWDDIIYKEDAKEWGIMQEGKFKSCVFIFAIPSSIEKNVKRFCRPKLVSSCPRGYTRATYRRACEAYMSVAVGNGATLYRNPHCAICNGVQVGSIKCFDPASFGQNVPFSFALLLDVNQRDGDRVGAVDRCMSGEKYDPYFKKCRRLVCAVPGYTMVDGKCVKK